MPQYRGSEIVIPSNDTQRLEYLREVAKHGALMLQRCNDCGSLRYPPGPACPDCRSLDTGWMPASGRGTIASYVIVPHAINPAFADWVPYPVVTVELDEQRNQPRPGYALRAIGNVVTANGRPEAEENVAIGKRVRVVTVDLGDGLALPQFTLSDEPPEHEPWQWPA